MGDEGKNSENMMLGVPKDNMESVQTETQGNSKIEMISKREEKQEQPISQSEFNIDSGRISESLGDINVIDFYNRFQRFTEDTLSALQRVRRLIFCLTVAVLFLSVGLMLLSSSFLF